MVKTKMRRNKRTLKNRSKKQSRKRCSHSRSSKCSNCRKQRGGNCSACNLKMMGGNYNPSNHEPGPFIGQSWTPSISGWPGVNGVGGDRNYLSQNLYKQDPQLMMKLGGKRGKKTRRGKKRKGGGLIPQDLVNLGRDLSYNTGSIYNALAGYPQPVNPLPYKDQFPRSSSIII